MRRGSDPPGRMGAMGFTRAELESFRDVEVPDLLPVDGQPLRLLFVGINPGLWTAATQSHFARPGNRFYPALLRAGILTSPIDPAAGMTDEDRDMLRRQGIGITNVAPRATARADELDARRAPGGRGAAPGAGHRAPPGRRGGGRRHRLPHGVRRAPGPGRRAARALGRLACVRGAQPAGLNAHETVATLALAYAEAARAAGVIGSTPAP